MEIFAPQKFLKIKYQEKAAISKVKEPTKSVLLGQKIPSFVDSGMSREKTLKLSGSFPVLRTRHQRMNRSLIRTKKICLPPIKD